MGIHTDDVALIVKQLGEDLTGAKIAVLGSQRLRFSDPAVDLCTLLRNRGAEVVGFDVNREFGCLPVDLCQPLDEQWVGAFTCVMNFGTTEHCYDQTAVFKNIHDMAVNGCLFIHHCPLARHWPKHSPFKYHGDFFFALGRQNGYRIELSEIVKRGPNRHNVRAVLQKITADAFQGIPRELIAIDSAYIANDGNNYRP